MAEKPILFSGEMVRAILAGRKCQTRRIVTRNNSTVLGYTRKQEWDALVWNGTEYMDNSEFISGAPNCEYLHVQAMLADEGMVWYRVRPRIITGDTLWVREAATLIADYRGTGFASGVIADKVKLRYEADGQESEWIDYPTRLATLEVGRRIANGCYREACRLRLNVTGVRVERLQDITEADARAEGMRWFEFIPEDGFPYCLGWTHLQADDKESTLYATAKKAFAKLWESINGPESWAANPWVWVYEFEKGEVR